jgi:hypothetical protein
VAELEAAERTVATVLDPALNRVKAASQRRVLSELAAPQSPEPKSSDLSDLFADIERRRLTAIEIELRTEQAKLEAAREEVFEHFARYQGEAGSRPSCFSAIVRDRADSVERDLETARKEAETK